MSSNVVDLANWLRLSLAEGSLGGTPITSVETLAATHTPAIMTPPPNPTIRSPADFYGLGWNITTDTTGAIRWSHSGAFSTGAATTAAMILATDIGIVVLTNGQPVGAPEAIADSFLQLLQTDDSGVQQNLELWSERFDRRYATPELNPSNPPASPVPARADGAYLGTYQNAYVGEVQIRSGDDGLALVIGPDRVTFPLTHWDGDVFIFIPASELPNYPSVATFEVGDSPEARSINISLFGGAGQGALARV